MFIVFEGVDASGKTTVGRLLANHLEAVYYATPPKDFLARREEVDLNASPDDHYRFYLDGVRQASLEIWDLLAEGKTVIGDRYWATTYVYHLVMGAKVSRTDFEGIVFPDTTVLLTVSPEVQAYRLAQRGMSAGDRRMLNRQEVLSREFKKFLVSDGKSLVAIDASHLTPSEVMTQALAEIQAFR
jgi:thymidylate kinase